MSNNQLSWRCLNAPWDLGVNLVPDNPSHVPDHALIPCAYLCANTRDSFGNTRQRVNLSLRHKPPWLILLSRIQARPGGTSHDWSRVPCTSAQHFTASCLPVTPARLWVLVWQGVAAYQTSQAQLLLHCIPLKYVLWGLFLDIVHLKSCQGLDKYWMLGWISSWWVLNRYR